MRHLKLRHLGLCACLSLSLLWLLPAEAAAQARLASPGMDLRLMRPALDSKGLLVLDGADILGANDISFGLILDGGFGLLPFEGFVNDPSLPAAEAERTDRLVSQMFAGTLHANFGIANLLVVGAQLPVIFVSGPNVTVPEQYNLEGTGGASYQGLGGVVLHGKIRILRPERDPIGLAASVRFEFPTASPAQLVGDSILAIRASLIGEWRPAPGLRIHAQAGYRLAIGDGALLRVGGRTEPADLMGPANGPVLAPDRGSDLRYDDLLTFGAGLGWRVAQAIELSVEVYGSQVVTAFGSPGALSLEALGGLKIFVDRSSYLLIGGGGGIPIGGFQSADARAMVGFVFEPSLGDSDGDGMRDDIDQCPAEPEDFDSFADEDGCPDPDNDRDGVLDDEDGCPMVPEDRDGDHDEDGCPEGNEGDRDGDGILDRDDQCPDEPEDRDGFEDEDGCPDPDNDQDGILDSEDLCPDRAEDRDGFEDDNGCPDLDNDQDRIPDLDDSCPDEPEEYNGLEDTDGCPDVGVLRVGEGVIQLFEQVHFRTDSAEILPESEALISAIASTLQGNPQLTLVEVQGHADDRSSDEYNLRLTRDRAASVVLALSSQGVDSGRLRSRGYGERCPLDPRHTDEARATNRRVEIRIVRTSEGPTGVELACPNARDLYPE